MTPQPHFMAFLVSTAGVVDSAVALAPERGLREAAEASVRWWVFQPGPARAWTKKLRYTD